MNCPKCNGVIEPGSSFCTECGSSLTPQTVKQIRIGRAADNDVVLQSPEVSKHHCIVTIQGSNISISDAGSSNGIYVNGERVQNAVITAHSKITLGKNFPLDIKSILNGNQTVQSLPAASAAAPRFEKGKQLYTIGRSSENDIVINNIKLSRKHARLIQEGGSWYLEDLGSANGTFVNGRKISREKVSLNDTITVAGSPIKIRGILEGSKEREPKIGEVSLTVRNATFAVQSKVIVDDISLTILPGEFVGLIGPSGAGKTSLMMMMNGVVTPSSGDVYLNNQSLFANYEAFKGEIGYVPQDDIIHRELQVEESLRYTARLRFGNTLTRNEINQQVDSVINTLDLKEARNTLIGTAEKKGISGGQRKRVNLGQELLTEPSVLFLDEPTSGLDPKTDMDVMHLLRGIADKGKIVVLTTHNITVENFEILTHVIVLTKGGKLAYYGPASEAVGYFGVNKPYEIFDALNAKNINTWKEEYRASNYHKTYVSERSAVTHTHTSAVPNKQANREANLGQFFILTERYLKVKLRDTVSTSILLMQAPIIALLISLVFKENDERVAATFVLVIAAIWLGCSNAAREIVSEQSIYKRERMVNLKIPSYLLSKVVVLSGLCIIQSVILAMISVPLLNMSFGLPELIILLTGTSIASLSVGLFTSALVKSSEAAMGLTPIILIPQVILGGLISKFADMNQVVKGLAALMISRWSFEAALIGEFGEAQKQIITGIGFSSELLILDFVIIFLFMAVFMLATGFALKRKD